MNMNTRFCRKKLNAVYQPPHKRGNKDEKEKFKKRRQHINFKIEINKKTDITIFTDFLEKDIKKRLKIDQQYFFDNNECHLKHLNFILMEILLHRVLTIFLDNFENNSSSSSNDEKENIKDEILYTPEKSYEKDLTIIKRQDILVKYKFMKNDEKLDEISNYIYLKYKSFEFINLNFLKRKIYEFI